MSDVNDYWQRPDSYRETDGCHNSLVRYLEYSLDCGAKETREK